MYGIKLIIWDMRDWWNVKEILDMESYYPQEYKERVFEIIMSRRRKYRYLF